MAWSYSGNPASSELDRYRFLLTDTVATDPLLQDEEILYVLAANESKNIRLYQLFQAIADIFGRGVRRSLGPQSEDPTERQRYFKTRAAYYRSLCSSSELTTPVYTTPNAFKKGLHDNV